MDQACQRNFLLQEKKTSNISYKTLIMHIYYIEITTQDYNYYNAISSIKRVHKYKKGKENTPRVVER